MVEKFDVEFVTPFGKDASQNGVPCWTRMAA